jgi:hypothetical protein
MEEVVLINLFEDGIEDVFTAKEEESNTKLMVMNRNRRIEAINRRLCFDYTKTKFKNWERCFQIIQPLEMPICICGMRLEKEAYIIVRDGITERICLGSECVKQLDKKQGTNMFEEMKKREKKCSECNKRKNLDEQFCKKCQEYPLCKSCKKPNKTSKFLECLHCYNRTIPLNGKCFIR